jgi:hypothetical protein
MHRIHLRVVVKILPQVIFVLTMKPSSTMYANGAGRGQPIYPLAKAPLTGFLKDNVKIERG